MTVAAYKTTATQSPLQEYAKQLLQSSQTNKPFNVNKVDGAKATATSSSDSKKILDIVV